MTIANTTRQAGPFVGNGTQVAFPFAFTVLAAADLLVLKTAGGVETVQTIVAQYTVALNSDQEANPGGTVTMGTAPSASESITILSNAQPLQPSRIPNGGGFYPQVIERGFDRLTILVQQLLNSLNRSLRLPSSDAASGLLPAATSRRGKILYFDPTTGAPTLSADDWANLTSASAANAAAAAASAVSAANSANAARNVFYGAFATDQTTRPDGSARQAGDCYYNTSSLLIRVWNGAAWANAYAPPSTTPYVQMSFASSTQVVADVSTGFGSAAGTNVWKFGTVTVDRNDGAGFASGTGIFTAPIAGVYAVAASMQVTTSASPTLALIQPLVAGAAKTDVRKGAVSSNYPVDFGFYVRLSAAQTLELRAWVADVNGGTLGAGTRVAPSGSLQIAYIGP